MTPEIVVIDKYTVEAQTIAPMHIGSGEKDTNEILIHPIWDRPFIQASGIAGALRAVSEAVNGTKVTQELFGGPHLEKDDSPMDVKSRLRISDGMFDPKTVHLEFRPRVRVSRRTGSVSSGTISGSGMDAGHKFEMEMIGLLLADLSTTWAFIVVSSGRGAGGRFQQVSDGIFRIIS